MLSQLNNQVTFQAIRSDIAVLILPAVAEATSLEALFKELSVYINELINTDFHRLVTLLYRLDISEEKLKQAVAISKGEQSADVIAKMIIERQIQKIIARQGFTTNNHIPEEDKW